LSRGVVVWTPSTGWCLAGLAFSAKPLLLCALDSYEESWAGRSQPRKWCCRISRSKFFLSKGQVFRTSSILWIRYEHDLFVLFYFYHICFKRVTGNKTQAWKEAKTLKRLFLSRNHIHLPCLGHGPLWTLSLLFKQIAFIVISEVGLERMDVLTVGHALDWGPQSQGAYVWGRSSASDPRYYACILCAILACVANPCPDRQSTMSRIGRRWRRLRVGDHPWSQPRPSAWW